MYGFLHDKSETVEAEKNNFAKYDDRESPSRLALIFFKIQGFVYSSVPCSTKDLSVRQVTLHAKKHCLLEPKLSNLLTYLRD